MRAASRDIKPRKHIHSPNLTRHIPASEFKLETGISGRTLALHEMNWYLLGKLVDNFRELSTEVDPLILKFEDDGSNRAARRAARGEIIFEGRKVFYVGLNPDEAGVTGQGREIS